jgi:hypothetical protein
LRTPQIPESLHTDKAKAKLQTSDQNNSVSGKSQSASDSLSSARGSGASLAASWREFRLNHPDSVFQVGGNVELGFVGIASHTIQFSSDGTLFDYLGEGRQDTLFFFQRLSLDLSLYRRHKIVLLYQPLQLVTQTTMRRDVKFDDRTFAKGTAVDTRYGFDFYRISYMYDFFPSENMELALGLSLQIRNAVINFTSVNGSDRVARQDIGPVPVIKMRGRYTFQNNVWMGFEIDGFWAPIRYLNGGASDVEGAIVDASLRVGWRLAEFADLFLNARYLGGGAQGTSQSNKENGDGFVANWIHAISISVGVSVR